MVVVTLIFEEKTNARYKYVDRNGANPPSTFLYLDMRALPDGNYPKTLHIVWDSELSPKFLSPARNLP
jgi:hypothetical protein